MNEKIDCRSSLGAREMKEVDEGDEVSLIDIWETKKWFESLSPEIKMRPEANVSLVFFGPLARGEFSHRLFNVGSKSAGIQSPGGTVEGA